MPSVNGVIYVLVCLADRPTSLYAEKCCRMNRNTGTNNNYLIYIPHVCRIRYETYTYFLKQIEM